MKKLYILLLIATLSLTACSQQTEEQDVSQTTPPAKTTLKIQEETLPPTPTESNENDSDKASKKKSKKEKYRDYLTNKIGIEYQDEVENDVTGNWYWSKTSTSKKAVEKYAVKYYKAYFDSDDELHAIINYKNQTTTSIQVLEKGVLDINTYKHVAYEEDDADDLFTGKLLSENLVYIKSGKVEKLQ